MYCRSFPTLIWVEPSGNTTGSTYWRSARTDIGGTIINSRPVNVCFAHLGGFRPPLAIKVLIVVVSCSEEIKRHDVCMKQ